MQSKQLEFLDMLAMISFGLQMEFLVQQRRQPTNSQVMQKLETIEATLDKLLQSIS